MNKNILWLPSWYPDKISPYNGDFIQRHAKAVGIYNSIQVIYFVRDEKGTVTRDVQIEDFISDNVKEKIVYYYSSHFLFPFIEKFMSGIKYKRIYKKIISEYIKQNGKPGLVHIHIILKAGLIAKWLKKKYQIPYVISEHWTGYLDEAKGKLSNYLFYLQMLWRKIMKGATAFSVVSDYFGECLKRQIPNFTYKVIPNVVDTRIFFPSLKDGRLVTNFIHISGLDYQKNPEDILKAFAILKTTTTDFHLIIVGPQHDNLKRLTKEFGLDSFMKFYSEMPQTELAKLVQESDALILYSRYETFGCVIIEANACGVPVIVSDLKVFHETVADKMNGIFVKGENPAALAEKLFWFIKNRNQFDHSAIAANAKDLYNFERVGKQFSKWYDEVLNQV